MQIFWVLFALLIPAYLLQAYFGFKQIKKFGHEYQQMRKEGKVAIGRHSGKIIAGTIVMLVLDDDGYICYGRKLQGISVFAKFKDFNRLNDRQLGAITIDDPALADEMKNTKKAVKEAIDNYNLVTNNQPIPEKKTPLGSLWDKVTNIKLFREEE